MQHKNMKRTHRARAFRLICCCIACALLVGAVLSAAADPQDKTSKAKQPLATTEKMDESKVIEARYVRADFAVNDFDNPAWRQAQAGQVILSRIGSAAAGGTGIWRG